MSDRCWKPYSDRTAEKVLLYVESYGEGYAQAIANTFDDVILRMAQVQLARSSAAAS